jgi:GDPmannose 4,6-dehydratase
MWRILQQDTPDDHALATGETHAVRDFARMAFAEAGIGLECSGSGVEEIGRCAATGRVLVRVDPRDFRPAEVDLLIGNPAKARRVPGWAPTVTLRELVAEMVRADIAAIRDGTDPVRNAAGGPAR